MTNAVYYEQALSQMNIDCEIDIRELSKTMSKMYSPGYHNKEFVGNLADSLCEIGLLNESSGMYTCSPLGDTLVEIAAGIFVTAERPDLLQYSGGPKKRELGSEMTDCKDYALEYLNGKIEVKDVVVYRTNYFINFPKSIKGIKCIEIKNKPEIRICVRKASPETIEYFASIDMTHRSTPAQTYFDMPRTIENIEKLVDALETYFNQGI